MNPGDATPLLAEARAVKTAQEIERMRLANEIAAAAMEHCKLIIEPGMTEAQIAAEWLGFVHGEGTGWEGNVELALGFSLVGPARDPDLHRNDVTPGRRGRADALRDLGLRRRVLVRPHEEPRRRRVDACLPRAGARLTAVYEDAIVFARPGASLAEARPPRPRRDRSARIPRPAVAPDLPRRRRARARTAVRAPSGRRRSAKAWCLQSSQDAIERPAGTSPRGQLPDHARWRGEAVAVPRWDSPGVTLDRSKLWTGDLNAKALEPQPRVTVGLYDTTLRDGEQTVGVVLSPRTSSRSHRHSTVRESTGSSGFPRVSEDDCGRSR